ncbi:MAG: ammonium transporter [Thermaerobacter sp.]|nr:ammonium transporter [Thermaerobacter sp.]
MLIPSASYLNPGDVSWQLIAATLVGLMSVPGLAVLYGGLVKRRFAVNSAMMVLYAFAVVLIVWVLWGYNMSFGVPWKLGPGMLSAIVGVPGTVLGAASEQARAVVPLLASAMPGLHFPASAMIYFQFAFAAITPGLLAGAALGRMNFKAWMIFVPLWTTLVYSVVAFSMWGGGWLAQLGAVDYSGGYVIHLAAGVSGFVLAAMLGPRLAKDRADFRPNNLMFTLVGAGILWLGWNGFNGGDPYFANGDAALAVLNTNIAAAMALLAWLGLDVWVRGRATLTGAINGMIAGLVAITPAAGYVNGTGALLIGLCAGVIPWLTMNLLGQRGVFRKVDDTLGVIHTHGIAGAIGGLMAGLLADPHVLVYLGVHHAAPAAVTGLFYGNPHQFLVQLEALVAIVIYDAAMTFLVLKLVGRLVPLRAADPVIEGGDRAMHGEEAYDYSDVPHVPHRPPAAVPSFSAEASDA